MELKAKTVIVTGSSRGIGRELALEFARQGANTVCCGRTVSQLEETERLIREAGGNGVAIPTDVMDWIAVNKLVERTVSEFGRIDILFNCAGSFRHVGPLWEADPETWWLDVTINLKGTMQCCRAVLPYMMKVDSGVIINMDGGGGSTGPNIGGSAYGCSKAAILRLSEGLAGELAREGSSIMVFCINPGFVWSDMTKYLISSPERLKWQRHVKEAKDAGRAVPSDSCARATMQLLRVACHELSGRIFYHNSDFEQISEGKEEIKQKNLLVLHVNSGRFRRKA